MDTLSKYDWLALAPEWVRNRQHEIAEYGVDLLGIAPGATVVGDIKIDPDSSFVILSQTCLIMDALGVVEIANGGFTVALKDSTTGRPWTNQPCRVECLFGNGQNPFRLPYPKVMLRNSAIQLTCRNISPVTTGSLRFVFAGARVYNPPINPKLP